MVSADTPDLAEDFKCLPVESKELLDKNWKDGQDHDCQWYFKAKEFKAGVCNLKEAADNCPTSCGSKQECYQSGSSEYKIYFAWDRIRLMENAHTNGSLCLGTNENKAQVVQKCRDWMASGEIGTLGGRGVSEEHDAALWHWMDTVWQV
jgi:hypothetical protein